ncbi:DUF262 domain-containing protein [Enterobacter hormaechei]|uniref:DUF262 domain-containing protein n=1 Tax=Enterobacter hormaechei TaxID=158836 RepID=UPI00125A97F4|nr:DUF262 domain-containing protein [Enterobacter hormaechei]QJP74305.1 DUF262 domain-containing protein [Enterobacter cloacae]VAM14607.1 Uncharacterized conserved protein [Enterobacter hormaechei]
MTDLINQIDTRRKEIFTDSYPMSIGELVNLYKDGEIDINPSFQRFFRWSHQQKVSLIESVLLGIPVPSIFVAQRDDGVWDLVDGLQRISTILALMGELKDDKGELQPPLILKGTKYLPGLDGKMWNGVGNNEIEKSIKMAFKREKIEIKIIKKESDVNTKFELFQRLNTGGSELSEQEVRNCLLIMLDKNAYDRLDELSKYQAFKDSISITERLYDERYDMELVLRLFVLGNSNAQELRGIEEVSEYLTNKVTDLTNEKFDWNMESQLFKKTFDFIYEVLEDNSFKKFDSQRGAFRGGFHLSAYEVLATGVYKSLKVGGISDDEVKNTLHRSSRDIFGDDTFIKHSGSGAKANYRWPRFQELIDKVFLNGNQP